MHEYISSNMRVRPSICDHLLIYGINNPKSRPHTPFPGPVHTSHAVNCAAIRISPKQVTN